MIQRPLVILDGMHRVWVLWGSLCPSQWKENQRILRAMAEKSYYSHLGLSPNPEASGPLGNQAASCPRCWSDMLGISGWMSVFWFPAGQ